MVVKYLTVLNYSIFFWGGGVKYKKNKRRWRT